MRVMRNRKGFTIIEAVLAIVILAVSFMGLATVLSSTTLHDIDLDLSTTAIMLARSTMAKTKAKPFADITNVSTTSYGGSFSDFFYNISVGCVDPADLDTTTACSGEAANYKRIVVTVTANGWNGNIELINLRTDNW